MIEALRILTQCSRFVSPLSSHHYLKSLTVQFCFFLAFTKYLNGKLEGNKKYAVFQRSFDEDGGYENQGFVQFTTKAFQFAGTESSKLKTKSKFPTDIAILVGVVLFVVLGITATCIVWRRCHQGREFTFVKAIHFMKTYFKKYSFQSLRARP